jgi:riboflavin kinase/FMN adenylyltransferase
VRIPFTKEFSQLSSEEFITQILVQTIGTKKLVIGHDHHFGKNREGSFEQLKHNAPTYGFEVEEIPRQDVDHIGVSSSKIRKALEIGDIETATHFLGNPYSITGRVVAGDKLGRILGFPTANIEIDTSYKLIPADAIYAVTVSHAHRLTKDASLETAKPCRVSNVILVNILRSIKKSGSHQLISTNLSARRNSMTLRVKNQPC